LNGERDIMVIELLLGSLEGEAERRKRCGHAED
jgi:hypothetical protein